MSEETTKKINGELNRKEFEKKYPNIWEKVSYYDWNKDEYIKHEYRIGVLVFNISYDTTEKRTISCEVSVINDDNREKFAQDPINFLLNELKNNDTKNIGDKAVINFAQETILKAIKGA